MLGDFFVINYAQILSYCKKSLLDESICEKDLLHKILEDFARNLGHAIQIEC
jgi:hypothetical protein